MQWRKLRRLSTNSSLFQGLSDKTLFEILLLIKRYRIFFKVSNLFMSARSLYCTCALT